MTEIEKKALALMNQVRDEEGLPPLNETYFDTVDRVALCRAIEQHEAFKQEVSDAVELANMRVKELKRNTSYIVNHMQQYIIPKPVDPLVEVLEEWIYEHELNDGDAFRATLAARGGKIVWGEG